MAAAPARKTTAQQTANIAVAFAVVSLVGVMLGQVPPSLLSLLLAANITLALLVLMLSLYMTNPLEISTFPTILLILTFFRLALNVASTKLILTPGTGAMDKAGAVIEFFGQVVAGNNPIIGFVVFLILIIIQFIVITRGAERVSLGGRHVYPCLIDGHIHLLPTVVTSTGFHVCDIENGRVEPHDLAGVREFANTHPQGFEMPIGERGESLSGGQRQAVAIARAVLNDPPVLLLDEPSSSMDHQSEEGLKQRLRRFATRKTIILVTHRTSLLDLGIAAAFLVPAARRHLALFQTVVVLGYTLGLTLLLPGLWLDPLGALTKNVAVLGLIAVDALLRETR